MNADTVLLIVALVSLATSSVGVAYLYRRSRVIRYDELQRALWRAWKDAQ